MARKRKAAAAGSPEIFRSYGYRRCPRCNQVKYRLQFVDGADLCITCHVSMTPGTEA